MNNSKKFENIKEELIFINEKQYKDEVVKRWGYININYLKVILKTCLMNNFNILGI